MLPYRVSNPGSLTYESGVLPIALRGPVEFHQLVQEIVGTRFCHADTDADSNGICTETNMSPLTFGGGVGT